VVVTGPRHVIPTAALIVAVLAAAAVMVSPLTPWTTAVVGFGAATAVAGSAVLILWLLRHGSSGYAWNVRRSRARLRHRALAEGSGRTGVSHGI
jgi:hypothetical protein